MTDRNTNSTKINSTTTTNTTAVLNFVFADVPLVQPCGFGDATSTFCEGGISAVMALLRYHSSPGDSSLVLPTLDFESPVVHMHPRRLGANRLVHYDRYGMDTYASYGFQLKLDDQSSILWGDLDDLRSPEYRPTIGSLSVAPNNPWSLYAQQVHFDQQTGMALIYVDEESPGLEGDRMESNTVTRAPPVQTALVLLEYIESINRRGKDCDTPRFKSRSVTANATVTANANANHSQPLLLLLDCWLPVVVDDRFDAGGERHLDLLESLADSAHPPALVLHLQSGTGTNENARRNTAGPGNNNTELLQLPGTYERGMWLASYQRTAEEFAMCKIEVQDKAITNVTIVMQKMEDIPEEARDTKYREDLVFLDEQIVAAARENDPVVGMSDQMPEQTYRLEDGTAAAVCLVGECPIGNLFSDAMRERTNADLSYVNPLGVRGPGWPAGPVKMSMLFEALPFPDSLCTGKLSGLSLFRIFDKSTSQALFEKEITPVSGWLLQVSGARIVYNTELSPNRLISVDIWNRNTSAFEPLDRYKIYKFALGSFDCYALEQFLDIFFDVPGEEPFTIDNILVHDVVARYLQELGRPYNTSIQGRLVDDTQAKTVMDWLQPEGSCPPGTFWEASYATCPLCPNTTRVVFREDEVRFEGESGSDTFFSETVDLFNGENFPVSIKLKSNPTWLEIVEERPFFVSLGPYQELSFQLNTSAINLEPGTARGTVSFQVLQDGLFSPCRGNDAIFEVLMKANPPPTLSTPGRVTIAVLVCVGLILGLAGFFAQWVGRKRKESVVSWMQPPLLLAICAGVSVISLSVIPLSLVDSISTQSGQDKACMAFPWLFCLGFSVVMTAATAQLWSVNRVFRPFRRTNINKKVGYVALGLMMFLNFSLLLLWTLIDPLKWVVQPVSDDQPWNLFGACQQEGTAGWVFLIMVATIDSLALVAAFYQAFKARNLDPAFSVSRSLLYALFSWIEILIVGLPVIFLVDRSNSSAFYFVQSSVILACCFSMLLLIFVRLRLEYRRTKQAQTGERRSTILVPAARKPSDHASQRFANGDGSTPTTFGSDLKDRSTPAFGKELKDRINHNGRVRTDAEKVNGSEKHKKNENNRNDGSNVSLTHSEVAEIEASSSRYAENNDDSDEDPSSNYYP